MTTIVFSGWAGNNAYSPTNDFTQFGDYNAKLNRRIGAWRQRGSTGQCDQPIIKNAAQAVSILNGRTVLSTNLNPRVGSSQRRWAVPYGDVLDGCWDTHARVIGTDGAQARMTARYGAIAVNDPGVGTYLSLTEQGQLMLNLQTSVGTDYNTKGFVICEMHSEANVGEDIAGLSPPYGAQPGVPDGPGLVSKGFGGDDGAGVNRKHFSDWVIYCITFWEAMGVHNVLYAISLGGRYYSTTDQDPWWANILAKEGTDHRTYVPIVGADIYSLPNSQVAKDWGVMCDGVINYATVHSKYACVFETGAEPGSGTGGSAGTATPYTIKPDFYQQAQQYGTIHKNRLWGVFHNMGNENTHFYEPETETAAMEPNLGFNTITNAVWTSAASGTITYTTASSHGIVAGNLVTVSNSTPTGFNKTLRAATTASGSTFTYTGVGATPGTYSSGGRIPTKSWFRFYNWANHADWAFGTPAVVPLQTGTGTATLQGTGSITATGRRGARGLATLNGTGSLTAAGYRGRSGAATIQGTGSLTAAGTRGARGAATISGLGNLFASGDTDRAGSVTIIGLGDLTAVGYAGRFGAASISGTGSLSATATTNIGWVSAATLDGTGSLVAAGVQGTYAAATLNGTGTLTGTGETAVPAASVGSALLQGVGTLTADDGFVTGQAHAGRFGDIPGVGELTVFRGLEERE